MAVNLANIDTATLIEAERQLRFQGVNHGSDFRTLQIRRRLIAIRAEIASRSTRRDCLVIES